MKYKNSGMAKQIEAKRTIKKVKRKGVVAKAKSSTLKSSKNYVKKYRGQGR
jgi:hypothetical protein